MSQVCATQPSNDDIYLLTAMISAFCRQTYDANVYYKIMQNAVDEGVANGISDEKIDKFIDIVTNIRKRNVRASMLSEMFPD
jgi:hypothetical protein